MQTLTIVIKGTEGTKTHSGQKQKLFMNGLNKRKSFIESVQMNSSNFKNEKLFLSFTAIITTNG